MTLKIYSQLGHTRWSSKDLTLLKTRFALARGVLRHFWQFVTSVITHVSFDL